MSALCLLEWCSTLFTLVFVKFRVRGFPKILCFRLTTHMIRGTVHFSPISSQKGLAETRYLSSTLWVDQSSPFFRYFAWSVAWGIFHKITQMHSVYLKISIIQKRLRKKCNFLPWHVQDKEKYITIKKKVRYMKHNNLNNWMLFIFTSGPGMLGIDNWDALLCIF